MLFGATKTIGSILVGMVTTGAKAALSGMIIGGIMGGLSAALYGGDVWDGIASSAMSGATSGFIVAVAIYAISTIVSTAVQAIRVANAARSAAKASKLAKIEKGIKPTRIGIDNVEKHLSIMDDFYANDAMVSRLEEALANGKKIYGADKNFYMHELKEMLLMNGGIPYGAAHETALNFYKVSVYSLYHPAVIRMQPGWWSSGYFNYWGIG